MNRTRGVGAAHDRRRADILDAVRTVTAERGVAAVSQASVAAAAGVSPGRVQHYFPTKDALLEATFDELNAAASARITDILGAAVDRAEPRRVLETVLGELIPHDALSRAHLQFRQAYTALALHHEVVAGRLRERYHGLHHDDLAPLIRRDQRAGLVAADLDAESQAVRLAALAEGLAYYVLIGVADAGVARAEVLAEIGRLYA